MADVRKIVELYDLYHSYKRVGRELNISHNTVRKYILRVNGLKSGTLNEILPKDRNIKQPLRVITDEIRGQIHQHLESNLDRPRKQRLNAKRIQELLIADGHQIGYTTVKREVARWRKIHSPRDVFILQEPKNGERAEFDWGYVDLAIDGVWSKYHLASMVLNHSLYRFARLFTRETQLEVLEGHIQFFREIGAVPENIAYDRMSTVYDTRINQLNPKFLEFATHYGFIPIICNPVSPHEKGTEEESIGYIRRNVFSERTSFQSLDEANKWLIYRLAEINTKPAYRRDLTPVQGLEQERAVMHTLPVLEFSNYILKRAKISRYSLVACESNRYSVPDTYRPRHITLRMYENGIEMLDGDSVIASHKRLRGKNEYSLNIAHFVKTFHKKPGAIRNAKVMNHLDTQIRSIFTNYYKDHPKEFLPILDLIRESSEQAISFAIDALLEREIVPSYDTLRVIIQQQYQMVQPFDISDQFSVNEPDLCSYDQLIGG
jgi:transposase